VGTWPSWSLDRCRVKVQTTQVKEDRLTKTFPVPKPIGHLLDPLNTGVDPLSQCVRRLQHNCIQDAFQMSLQHLRHRDHRPKICQLRPHSDRGVQYAAEDYVEVLEEHGFTISMSRKGNPYDNAQAESFMKTLKVEEVYVSEYRTFAEVKERIGEFIELIYNQERLHSALGYVSPLEFEQEVKSAPWHVSISAPTCLA